MLIYLSKKSAFSILILFCLVSTPGFCQYDTAKLEVGFKTMIYLNSVDIKTANRDSFVVFMQQPILIEEIRSDGFRSHIRFFQVKDLDVQLKSHRYLFLTSCPIEYIIAFDTRFNNINIYRLKGFETNDFLYLLQQEGIRRSRVKKLSIANVDIECLMNASRSAGKDYRKYPCLRGCGFSQGAIH